MLMSLDFKQRKTRADALSFFNTSPFRQRLTWLLFSPVPSTPGKCYPEGKADLGKGTRMRRQSCLVKDRRT